MKENLCIPWKRMLSGAVVSVLVTFILTFIITLLCNSYIISIKIARMSMFAVAFLSAFVGGFMVSAREKNLMFTLVSSAVYFVILNIMGIFTGLSFSADNTLYVLIVITFAAVLNSLLKAVVR